MANSEEALCVSNQIPNKGLIQIVFNRQGNGWVTIVVSVV